MLVCLAVTFDLSTQDVAGQRLWHCRCISPPVSTCDRVASVSLSTERMTKHLPLPFHPASPICVCGCGWVCVLKTEREGKQWKVILLSYTKSVQAAGQLNVRLTPFMCASCHWLIPCQRSQRLNCSSLHFIAKQIYITVTFSFSSPCPVSLLPLYLSHCLRWVRERKHVWISVTFN